MGHPVESKVRLREAPGSQAYRFVCFESADASALGKAATRRRTPKGYRYRFKEEARGSPEPLAIQAENGEVAGLV